MLHIAARKGPSEKTMTGRRTAAALLVVLLAIAGACSSTNEHAAEEEEEALSRTEFTDRIENFFEHDPLKAGKPSQFLIHLTDLTDGTSVEKADVTLTARPQSGAAPTEVKAKVGKVTGIYVAELALPSAGTYDIEFHVRNEKIDERMALTDFEVTAQ